MTLWSRRRDYLRLYGHEERQGFYERLDSFASAARAAPSCVTAAGCFRKRASLARGGRVNRQPRIMCRISKRFGGCGSNPSQQQRPRDGRNAISGSCKQWVILICLQNGFNFEVMGSMKYPKHSILLLFN